MFGSEILEVVIGLIFIYLLLSLFATTIGEMIAKALSLRGRNLKNTLKYMFNEPETIWLSIWGTLKSIRSIKEKVLEFFKHIRRKKTSRELDGKKFNINKFYSDPEIKKLSSWPILTRLGLKTPPDFLAKEVFSKILIKAIFKSDAEQMSSGIDDLEVRINEMFSSQSDANKILKRFVRESSGRIEQIRLRIEEWYDDIMIVATEWYKSKVRLMLFIIGLVISILFNANTFSIVKKLQSDPATRKVILEKAVEITNDSLESEPLKTQYSKLKELENQFADTTGAFGMGWKREFTKNDSVSWDSMKVEFQEKYKSNWFSRVLLNGKDKLYSIPDYLLTVWLQAKPVYEKAPNPIIGWFLTALAISFGAPFWFDMLKKLLRLRHAGTEQAEAKSKTPKAVG